MKINELYFVKVLLITALSFSASTSQANSFFDNLSDAFRGVHHDCAQNEDAFAKVFDQAAASFGSDISVAKVQESKIDPANGVCHLALKLSDDSVLGGYMYIQPDSTISWFPDEGREMTPLEKKITDAQEAYITKKNAEKKAERDKRVTKFLQQPIETRVMLCDGSFRLAIDRGIMFTPASVKDFYYQCIYKANQIF